MFAFSITLLYFCSQLKLFDGTINSLLSVQHLWLSTLKDKLLSVVKSHDPGKLFAQISFM